LLYHNHAFEFENGGRIMNAILEGASADVGFCPDVGWVHKAGVDVIGFLERIHDRIGAVHYKDFAPVEGKAGFCLLGDGVTPFEAITEWLRTRCPGQWIIAEQDKADVPAEVAVAKNGAYLRQVTGL
jgi:sugar phosphate isomerase/epimerase